MCEPATLTLASAATQFVTGAGSAIAGAIGQGRAYRSNARAAIAAYGDDVEALNARRDQIGRSASEDILSNEIAALQERGRVNASATGLADVSLGEVLQGVAAQKQRAKTNITFNRNAAFQQNDRERKGALAAAQARINSVARPSMAALGFNILGAAAEAGTTYSQLKDRGR